MPLSEYEQQMLRQMEEALSAEDPQFASQLRNHGLGRPSARRLALGIVGLAVGLGLIVAAILQKWTWLGAVGFAVMVASVAQALWPMTSSGDGAPGAAKPGQAPAAAKKAKRAGRQAGFMQRMEERWDRRRDEQR